MTSKEREIGRLERDIMGIEMFLKFLPLEENVIRGNIEAFQLQTTQSREKLSELIKKGTEYLTLLPKLKFDLAKLKK